MEGRYTVRFVGRIIYCTELRHAAALQRASDILNEIAAYKLTPDELAETTRILHCYGERNAARQLEQRAELAADPMPTDRAKG